MTKRKLDLSWDKLCQKCRKLKPTTRYRHFYAKNYVGPCGDSFCYYGCDSSSCKEQTATICDECCNSLKKDGT